MAYGYVPTAAWAQFGPTILFHNLNKIVVVIIIICTLPTPTHPPGISVSVTLRGQLGVKQVKVALAGYLSRILSLWLWLTVTATTHAVQVSRNIIKAVSTPFFVKKCRLMWVFVCFHLFVCLCERVSE